MERRQTSDDRQQTTDDDLGEDLRHLRSVVCCLLVCCLSVDSARTGLVSED